MNKPRLTKGDPAREALVRAVLTAPVEMESKAIANKVGTYRDTVRLIRIGRRFADVATDLPRIDPEHFKRRCTGCLHFIHNKTRIVDPDAGTDHVSHGACSLGIPEAYAITYARGCGAFVEAAA